MGVAGYLQALGHKVINPYLIKDCDLSSSLTTLYKDSIQFLNNSLSFTRLAFDLEVSKHRFSNIFNSITERWYLYSTHLKLHNCNSWITTNCFSNCLYVRPTFPLFGKRDRSDPFYSNLSSLKSWYKSINVLHCCCDLQTIALSLIPFRWGNISLLALLSF